MKARTILLTHFSQRYPKIPIICSGEDSAPGDNSTEDSSNVAVAFDLMTLNLDQMEWAHHLLPVLQALFNGETEAEDESS